jgi:methylase of polypeptide subunit release factors
MMLSPNRGSEGWGPNLDSLSAEDKALVELGNQLRDANYQFVTITPASHQRVIGRHHSSTSALRDVFGWSRPFEQGELPANIVSLLHRADELESDGKRLRSRVRASTLGGQLFMHSAFPTDSGDAVFFGPDTYRFARALRQVLVDITPAEPFTIVDVGCGSGAGGLHAVELLRGQAEVEVILSDINPKALRYSRINAAINGVSNVRTVLSNVFDRIDEAGDLIISNPPYLVDRAARLYRHGGDNWGCDLSVRIVEEGLDRLQPGGRLFLYTGTPVIDGLDVFFAAIRPRLEARQCEYAYEEIDPDVFGEELESRPYDRADRIAAVALTIDFPKEYRNG